mgnify:CR=1 FL=1|jgi:shikimate kinase
MHNEFTNPNVIILLGYMGCGKSTVGAALAKQLNLPFEDLDSLITEAHTCSIPELFATKGVKKFRELEHETLIDALKNPTNRIVSLGGGTPCYHDNMTHINMATPYVFYLETTPASLAARLFFNREKRPLIAHTKTENELKEFVAKHLFERQSFYRKANHRIVVDTASVQEVVDAISDLC